MVQDAWPATLVTASQLCDAMVKCTDLPAIGEASYWRVRVAETTVGSWKSPDAEPS